MSHDAASFGRLRALQPGQEIVFGGDRVVTVPAELSDAFRSGDQLVVVQESGALLHIPAADRDIVREAVGEAVEAFYELQAVGAAEVTAFYRHLRSRLLDDQVFAPVLEANRADVASARRRGRSTGRLELTEKMHADMVAALLMWEEHPDTRGQVDECVEHDGWDVTVERRPLGVVGFVFEGRPNVFADASGVLRGGNTVVMRIGSDALGTARAMVTHVVEPSLAAAGLPRGAVKLVDAASHAAGWALFDDGRLALAVARGSGPAVAQLGAVARQRGVPVSLHGTGGAWMIVDVSADPERLRSVVATSLDRKVCNTLNTCVVLRAAAEELVPVVLAGLQDAAHESGVEPRLHVVAPADQYVAAEWFEERAAMLDIDRLGHEWEWDSSPEISLVVADDLDHACAMFNEFSPKFVVSTISESADAQERVGQLVDAPFVGDGFTRWVDGQYALGRPELGLSNWEGGRLFARAGVLSGDSVFTQRMRVRQSDSRVRR